jgi:hypothetical protein
MKRTALIALLVTAIFSATPAMAEKTTPQNGAQIQQNAPNMAEFDKQMKQMQEKMKKMQDQMDKIHQTKDPQTRQKLLKEHWSTMQNNMHMMDGMWGPDGCMGMTNGMRMGHGMMMGWDGMDVYYSKHTPEQMKQRQYIMDRYMPMQQRMMEHMMQHQHEMWGQPSR